MTECGHVLAEAVEEDHEDVIDFGDIDATPGDELRARIKGHTGGFYADFPYSKSVRPDDYEVHGREAAEDRRREERQKQRDEKLLEKIQDHRSDHDESRRRQPTDERDEEVDQDKPDDLRGVAVRMGVEETTEEQRDPQEE
ncbi:hypothetical protein RYH80_20025 [Halobaculum sp. MBLA0147]|uniref:hypothetical protein n=1 Tax=Halobaculum sp. MBLA0147 TaxID=3079934 RepID=UPI003523DB70